MLNCDNVVFKFFCDDESNIEILNSEVFVDFGQILSMMLLNRYKVVCAGLIEKCPCCGSDLNKNGTYPILLNKKTEIKVQKYVCSDKNCEKHTQTFLNKFKDKYCNYTREIRQIGMTIGSIDYMSYEKKSELIEMFTGVKIPRQTVYYHENTLSEEYLVKREKEVNNTIKKLKIEPSGVYHYDEEVLWVNTEMKLRMTILDANNNLIIGEKVVTNKEFSKKND